MEIEAWLLAFTEAVSIWAKIREEVVIREICENINQSNFTNLELIKRPSVLLSEIGKIGQRQHSKSVGSITLIVNNISKEHIEKVYDSNLNSKFSQVLGSIALYWLLFILIYKPEFYETIF